MSASRFRPWIAVSCLALLSLSTFAEDARAILSISGKVTVNGKAVQGSSTPIFDGDRIEVGSDSTAGITSNGSIMTLDANSSLTYQRGTVNFGCGTAILSASGTSITAIINGIRVSFGAQPSKVQISDKDGVLLVKTLAGSAEIQEASGTSALAEGFSLARPGSTNCATAQTGTTTESKTVKPHSNSTTYILIGVGAGGAVGAALAVAGGKGKGSNTGPTSPSAP